MLAVSEHLQSTSALAVLANMDVPQQDLLRVIVPQQAREGSVDFLTPLDGSKAIPTRAHMVNNRVAKLDQPKTLSNLSVIQRAEVLHPQH